MLYFSKIVRLFWGEMSSDELKRFGILSSIYFFLIGAYWLIRVMKDGIFTNLVGYQYQPFAKMISLVVVICVVLFYNKLVDLLKRDTLFYCIATFFGIGFLALGYWISHPDLFSAAPGSTLGNVCSFIPGKALGWIAYCFIESYGSVVPGLFLAIVASTMSTELAKKGYGMMYTFAQLGLILGTSLVMMHVKTLGCGLLLALGGIVICILPFLMRLYIKNAPATPVEKIEAAEHKSTKTGMLEGLKLILSRPYVAGLLVVSTMYEIIGTIVEYKMGLCATTVYPTNIDGGAGFVWFKALNGLTLGVLSLSFALLGTSILMRKLGLKFCIISYPVMIGISIASIFGFYLAGASVYFLMWAFFLAVILFKGLSYTLNGPAVEVMYIPTSKDVKFKAKSWISGFGGRTSKGIGATVTGSLGANFSTLLIFGTFASLGLVAFWIFVAAFVGNKYNQLQKENKIVE
jgi:AAA family ATP:ADP antiporter